ncbi:efflux RND transporter periplasmic adaptor subunit [Deinococcus cellulosilyticus]|uniref:Secretion protein HlyD n=1 Tax=Deinococcus cellulosilyticus (strain DSM 18568 / NBRC 106333 / KACC 11606 / 5516J-15) TaxID=1223518 RepID=A0A511MZX2_DEIC1|nr:efflux RND transporter periplasmic adaptor subunit [Deinococcus cellulosilyticus]GEM45676.1 secretion protein HlyD [Deinococcus cellulosilyticus NBRC 106333 = KACC 11606]
MTTAVRKNPPKGRKRLWWWLVPVVLVGGFFALPRPGSMPTVLDTVPVSKGNFQLQVSGSGTLKATDVRELHPDVSGTVTFLIEEGRRVKSGEVLVKMDDQEAENNLLNARTSLQTAENNLKSSRASSSSNTTSQQQAVETARVNVQNARRELQSAQDTLTLNQRLYQAGGVSQQTLTDAQTALQKASDALKSAQVAYQAALNTQQTQQTSNQQSIDNASLSVESARTSLQTAQTQLQKHTLKAPVDSQVLSVTGTVGGPSSAVTVEIGQDRVLELPMQVDETGIRQVQTGQEVEVTLDAFPGKTFRGKVSEISPKATLQQNIPVFYVTVKLSNPEQLLRPGMSAQAEITVLTLQDVLKVPKRAVKTTGGRSTVEVQMADGKTAVKDVQTGETDGTEVVITSGLTGDEKVVLPTRKTVSSAPTFPPTPGGQ